MNCAENVRDQMGGGGCHLCSAQSGGPSGTHLCIPAEETEGSVRTQHVGQQPPLSAKSLHNDVQNQDPVVDTEKREQAEERLRDMLKPPGSLIQSILDNLRI